MENKQLYLIRHAKSSWQDTGLTDFDRPLNKRGERDAPEMGNRLALASVMPQLVVSSPARRAKSTAGAITRALGYRGPVSFDEKLYLGTLRYHLELIEGLMKTVDSLFLVGHNPTITELAEYLTGREFTNVPTCGIVAISYVTDAGFSRRPGDGRLLFFDYPKNKEPLVKSSKDRG